jgi:hypothetical protein
VPGVPGAGQSTGFADIGLAIMKPPPFGSPNTAKVMTPSMVMGPLCTVPPAARISSHLAATSSTRM